MITYFCSKFIPETTYQISSESPEFCRRYYKKMFYLFPDSTISLCVCKLLTFSVMFPVGSTNAVIVIIRVVVIKIKEWGVRA